jgi:hypothetical protein
MATVNDAILKILTTPDKITEVLARGNEYYFRFGGHAFSVLSRTEDTENLGEHSFYVYPDWPDSLESLSAAFERQNDIKLVVYNANELPPQTQRVLRQLAKLLEEKSLNVHKVFDDVVKEE